MITVLALGLSLKGCKKEVTTEITVTSDGEDTTAVTKTTVVKAPAVDIEAAEDAEAKAKAKLVAAIVKRDKRSERREKMEK